MKYWKPSDTFIKARQRAVADELCASMGLRDAPDGLAVGAPYKHNGDGGAAASSNDASAAGSRHASMSGSASAGAGSSSALDTAVLAALAAAPAGSGSAQRPSPSASPVAGDASPVAGGGEEGAFRVGDATDAQASDALRAAAAATMLDHLSRASAARRRTVGGASS